MQDFLMLHTEHAATYFAWSKNRYWEIKGRAFSPMEKSLQIQAYINSQIGLHEIENSGILIRLVKKSEIMKL